MSFELSSNPINQKEFFDVLLQKVGNYFIFGNNLEGLNLD